MPSSSVRPALPGSDGWASNISGRPAMPGETSFGRFLNRSWAAFVLLMLVVAGILAGVRLADALREPAACVAENITLAGALSLAATLLSLAVTASKDGLEGLAKIWRAASRGGETIRLLDVGRTMIGLAAASVFLSFFVVVQRGCEEPEICRTEYDACRQLPAGAECRACNAHERVLGEIENLKNDLQQLKLHRVGAFPLLFDNAGIDDGKLSRDSYGIELPYARFEQWQENVFGDAAWPLGEDVGYCIVGYSSTAPFRGRRPQESEDLNVLAANLRMVNFARTLHHKVTGQVAKCKWRSYDEIARPRLLVGDHLSEQDKHLISRSVFAHAVSLEDVAGDLGAHCTSVVAERTGSLTGSLECSEV